MIKKQYILAIMLAFLMIFSLTTGCLENEKESDGIEEPSIILTVFYDDYQANYSLENLEALDSYTGTGAYIKDKFLPDDVITDDVREYTGVRVTTLLEEISDLPENYTVSIVCDDGYTKNFTMNQTLGYMDVYNETGTLMSNETAVMIVAYKENGSYYSEIDPENEIGPLITAHVGNNTIYTSSGFWLEMVVSIEVLSN